MTVNESLTEAPAALSPPPGEQAARWSSVSSRATAMVIALLAGALACLSLALQIPGQISMDTSIQLHEAFTGQSESFNPPLMSALLRWLGGGSLATSLMVLIDTLLLYGSFALVAVSIAQQRVQRLPLWRAALAVLVILNPLVFLYAGIVWKDVLFASLLTSGCALCIAASAGPLYRRYACGLVALLLLAVALITRQQGVFMVPFMVLGVIAALWPRQIRQRICLVIAVVSVFFVCETLLQRQVEVAIKPPVTKATAVGFRSLMIYDLAGMVSHSARQPDEYASPITQEQLNAIRAVYTPERIDTLDQTPLLDTWIGGRSSQELKSAWWAMLKQNPQAYLAHRFAAFSKLMGLDGIHGTLPIHVGIEGNAAYLAQLGMDQGRTQRTQLIYDVARHFFSSPLYRHAFWLGALVVIAAIAGRARLPRRLLVIGALIATATLLMYASYLPTAIAADFRYLFGAIPLVMLLALVLLLGAPRRRA